MKSGLVHDTMNTTVGSQSMFATFTMPNCWSAVKQIRKMAIARSFGIYWKKKTMPDVKCSADDGGLMSCVPSFSYCDQTTSDLLNWHVGKIIIYGSHQRPGEFVS